MATSVPPTPPAEPVQPTCRGIAPVWHAVAIAAFMIAVSLSGASRERHALSHHERMLLYLMTMAAEWLIVAFVIWGVKRSKRITLRELIGGRWSKPEDFLLDLAIAAGFLIVSMITLGMLGLALGLNKQVADAQKLALLAPQGGLEIFLWICVSSTAGFCEELIFRGYFQRQIAAWTGLAWVGVVGQGIMFGFSHGYEGPKRMVLIAIFGMMFGIVALWRKSLRPGMFTHTSYDVIAGLALRLISK